MPLSTTIYFVGIVLGSLVGGWMSDFWGRKKVLIACLYIQGILGVFVYFADSLEVFMVLRLIQGFFAQVCLWNAYYKYC